VKVAFISFHSFYHPGGVKSHILGLAEEFKRRGIEVKIIVPRRKRSENYGKDVILLGTSFPVSLGGTETDLVINFNPLSVENLLKKEKFDVLHFHNFTIPSAFQILEKSEALNILTVHANTERSKFLKNSGFIYLCKKVVQWKVDGLIGVADLNLEGSEDYKGPKVVIPNGIDLEKFNPQVNGLEKFSDNKIKTFDGLSLDSERGRRINILFLGRIEERKGLIYLLKAYKLLEKLSLPLRLIIVGEGPLKKEMEEWVKDNNLKNVIFEGKATEEDITAYYKSCDIFCAPSVFGESFGIVLVEAMACGKPVVAFANRGYKGVLDNTKGARFLVKPKDHKELAEKLEILIKNPKLRKEMGQWGIKEAEKYSWQKIADKILDFYRFCSEGKKKQKTDFSLEKSVNKFLDKLYNQLN